MQYLSISLVNYRAGELRYSAGFILRDNGHQHSTVGILKDDQYHGENA
jgi:hypothetical protein